MENKLAYTVQNDYSDIFSGHCFLIALTNLVYTTKNKVIWVAIFVYNVN